ncbi:MAG: EAL domain-containing protein [Campylobacterota bacterium]|nr:EAL domain-containing protein [Campylobacterota bacterium]
MLLPQTKEREYRFKLALRMGLPIFALIIALVSHTLIENYATLQPSFYIEAIILLVFSIYFFLYLIYNGYNVKITDDVSKTFTREYLYKDLNKKLKTKEEYTLILLSIDNLDDINTQYGIKNGDRVLEKTAIWIGSYLKSQGIENFPLGHIKGGDFVLGVEGLKERYQTILELMCLKSNEFQVSNIEIKISGAISDSSYSKELDYIIENLFEIQEEKRNSKSLEKEELTPNELESYVINAINKRKILVMSQDVFENDKVAFKECFVKLKTPNGKYIFTKTYTKVIKKLGLNIEYDLMVLESILLNKDIDKNITYALNISPSSLRNERFLAKTKELVKGSEINIILVLSETEYFSHTSRYNGVINSLKSHGVSIAIDRLGSIHTSFLYLRELDIDMVRFDKYYSNENKMSQNLSILDGFNLIAHQKNIKTWIKNIETKESAALSKSIKIDYLQGKEFSTLEKIFEN